MWSAEMLEEITSLAHEVGGWSKLEQLLREAERQERPWPHTCEPTCAHDLKSYNSGEEHTFGDCIADVHEALSEARKAYRIGNIAGHAFGAASELADVVIRVADMAEFYGVDLASLRVGMNVSHDHSFGDYISFAHEYLSGAYGAYRIGLREGLPNRWDMNMAWLVRFITVISERYGIDLDAAVEAKMAYNRGRSYRHGGKPL